MKDLFDGTVKLTKVNKSGCSMLKSENDKNGQFGVYPYPGLYEKFKINTTYKFEFLVVTIKLFNVYDYKLYGQHFINNNQSV